MSRSIPYDLCMVYKAIWEKENGGRYFITPVDLKWAKDFLMLNGEVTQAEVEANAKRYFQEDFWANQGYPASGLFRNWNSFTPKTERPVVRKSTYHCVECGQDHPISEKCGPISERALKLINSINKS